jgi:PAS domain S-box-containing protein
VRGAAAVAGLIGATHVVLWLAGVPPRWSAAGAITVKTNMALAQVLGAVALLLVGGLRTPVPSASGRASSLRRAVALGLSTLVFLIGLATLTEHLLSLDLHIDQLLATEPPGALGVTSPNRMGPPGAISLTLLGAGLFLRAAGRRGATVLGVVVCGLVLLPAIGMLYGIGQLHATAVTGIAWPAVIALFALGLGLSLVRAAQGVTSPIVWRDDPGGALFRRMVAPAVLLPVVIGFVRLWGEWLGLYPRLIGTGLFALSLSTTFFLLVWRTGERLSAAAAARAAAEASADAALQRDVEARERAQSEREALGQQLRIALDAARLGWWHHDPATMLATNDARFREIFGMVGERHTNEEVLRLIHPEDLPRVWAAVIAAMDPAHPVPYAVEYRIIRLDGDLRWIEAHGLASFEGEGSARRAVSLVGTVSDITDRKAAGEALRESTALLQAISDTIPDPLFAKDREGRFTFANPATLRAIGKTSEQVLGRNELGWLEDAGQARSIMANDRAIMDSGETRVVEEWLRTPEGDRVFLGTKSPLRGGDGQVVGLVGLSRDITERKQMEEALREADRHKDEFLGMLSHELRNPLAPIRNALYILDHADPFSDQARRARSVASRQVAHLTRLVDDLLDVTRIARGKAELHRSALDLAALVRRAAEDHRGLLQERGVQLTVDSPALPVLVNGDDTRLAQVLGNLLHNASKFTPAGGRVDVIVTRRDGAAVVRVRDTGAGIEPALLRSVFDPFTQAEQTLARSEGGLGLGLALVKGLVGLHGGEVAARSDGPGRGAELEVRLPLLDPTHLGAVEARPAAASPTARLHVLVVDDNRDAAETLAQLVTMFGHDAEVAFDGQSALDKAIQHPPDVVLCDLGLPGMDGYAVARRLRAAGAGRTRLIALSGYAQPEDVVRAEEAGFDGHLAKPADPSRIEDLLG